jgi:hypothetical protein
MMANASKNTSGYSSLRRTILVLTTAMRYEPILALLLDGKSTLVITADDVAHPVLDDVCYVRSELYLFSGEFQISRRLAKSGRNHCTFPQWSQT